MQTHHQGWPGVADSYVFVFDHNPLFCAKSVQDHQLWVGFTVSDSCLRRGCHPRFSFILHSNGLYSEFSETDGDDFHQVVYSLFDGVFANH